MLRRVWVTTLHSRFSRHLALPATPAMAGGGVRWAWALAVFALVVIGVIARSYWYISVDLPDVMTWQGYPILTSTDGFFFATGVGNVVSDAWGPVPPRLAEVSQHAVVGLGWLVVEVFGVSQEAAFTWMPPLVGALVVLPVFWLGCMLAGPWVGWLAGLGIALAPAHVVRTTVGYFDTDMFAVVVPLTVAAMLIRVLATAWGARATHAAADDAAHGHDTKGRGEGALPASLLAAALALAAYPYFYDQGNTVVLMMVVTFAGLVWFSLWEARRSGRESGLGPWGHRAVAVVAVAALAVPVWWGMLAVAVAFVALRQPLGRPRWEATGALVVLLAVAATSPAVRSIYVKVKVYGGAEAPTEATAGALEERVQPESAAAAWKRQDTTGLVAEAKVLPFDQMLRKAIGDPVVCVLGLLGLFAFILWRPALVMAFPVLVVGLFAFIGGHRFLIYLSPFVALGLAYASARVAAFLPSARWRGPAGLLGALMMWPAFVGTMSGMPPTAMVRSEVEALTALGERAKREDTTISWWDFGYPIAYYARTHNITDGSRRGDDAALAAEVLLTDSQALSNRLARLAAAAEARSDWGAAGHLTSDAREAGLGPLAWLEELRAGRWPVAEPPGDVYLYLPLRLLPIAPALEVYRPSEAGRKKSAPYLRVFRGVRTQESTLVLADGLEVDAKAVQMRRRNPKTGEAESKALNQIHSVTGSGKSKIMRSLPGDPKAKTAGVFLRDVAIFVELDVGLLTSVWAQLFFFENADPTLFELVISNSAAKVFKVVGPREKAARPSP